MIFAGRRAGLEGRCATVTRRSTQYVVAKYTKGHCLDRTRNLLPQAARLTRTIRAYCWVCAGFPVWQSLTNHRVAMNYRPPQWKCAPEPRSVFITLTSSGQWMLMGPDMHIQCVSYFSLTSSTSWLHSVLSTMKPSVYCTNGE